MSRAIPTPFYTLLRTSIDGAPALVTVERALLAWPEQNAFAWHLVLSLIYAPGRAGWPAPEALESLHAEEDRVTAALNVDDNALFLCRTTCNGARELQFRVADPEAANSVLQGLIAEDGQQCEWDYEMRCDGALEKVAVLVALIARADGERRH